MRSFTLEQPIDFILFFHNLTQGKPSESALKQIELIGQELGRDIWERAVIICTFADVLTDTFLSESLEAVTESFQTIFPVARTVPVIAISNLEEATPQSKGWLSSLRLAILNALATPVKR